MASKQIWFVRHGESLANAGAITSVSARVPLTEKGRAQADAVARTLEVKPSLIVSSPYDRATETAAPTLKKWPGASFEVWPIQEFTYLSWDKMGPTTAAQRELMAIPYWDRMDPAYSDGDDAESYLDLVNRVDDLISRIKSLSDENAIVFTHKLFLCTLFFRLVNQGRKPPIMEEVRTFMKEYDIPNGAIVHYSFEANGCAYMIGTQTDHLKGRAAAIKNTGV